VAHDRRLPALSSLAGYLGTTSAVAAVTLLMWLLRAHLTAAPIALFYLLVVFASALAWGTGAAIAGSVLAALAFDYFFVPPIFTLTVASPHEAFVLVVFLVVTIVASRLAAQASAQAREARRRAWESQVLYELSDAIAGAGSADQGLSVIAEHAARTFGATHCTILVADALGALETRAAYPPGQPHATTRDEDGVASYAASHDSVLPYRSSVYVPIQASNRRIGTLKLGPRSSGQPVPVADHRLLRTFAAAAAVAIERRRLQEVATQAEILRRSDELKSALLNAVSHDLRTPLAAIKTSITALLQEHPGWDRDAQAEMLSTANTELDRLNRLIDDLLDLSRIEAGALKPNRQWYVIGELIGDIVRRLRTRFHEHIVCTSLAEHLPLVLVDYVQIQQVLANLVENAAGSAPPGTEIVISAGTEAGQLVLRVRDHGPGVPPAEADRIFSKFYRIGNRRRGTGLGLAICRGLVDAHGGRVWVENPGQPGAVFAVALPIHTPAQHAPQPATADR